jgi:hypothetical protein
LSPGDPACEWQRYEIRVSYTDTSGNYWDQITVGRLWILHNVWWVYPNGSYITYDAERPNPAGSGPNAVIRYINWRQVSNVYGGAGGCSTGSHTHIEFFSMHNWGKVYEWHSAIGPDGFYDGSHIHWSGFSDPDSLTAGVSKLGNYGESSTTFWMVDNPQSSTH